MSKKINSQFKLLPIAAAIMLAFGNAYAEEVQELITPGNSVSVGVGASNGGKDAKRFSQYTGLNQSASLLLDFEINKRDDETGTWMIFNGRNLGLDTRELSYSRSKQGDWKYVLDYNEIVRRDPYIINTGMTGVGTTTPNIVLIANPTVPASAGTWAGTRPLNTTANTTNVSTAASPNGYLPSNGVVGSDVELKLKRTAIGFSGDKWFTPEIQFELSFRNEEKKGARLFGRAGLDSGDMAFRPANATTTTVPNIVGGGVVNPNGGWAVLLTPEPINSVTRQLEAKLNFNRDKLALTGGYYGSFYVNSNGSLSPNVPGTLNRGALWTACTAAGTGAALGTGGAGCSTVQQLASSAVALPPDNQAHQVYLSGNYAFTDTTRSTFKASYTHATQNESFAGMGLTPATGAPASLGGVVDTTLMHLGLTMRPIQDLSVNGSIRYENRADKTPVAVYNTNGISGSALYNTTNWPSGSQTRTTAKLDGIYRLPSGYSVLLGGDWERKASPLPPANTALFNKQVFFRDSLTETGVRAELRKALSETVNGALGVEYKQRRGSDGGWVTASGTAGNPMISFDPASTVITGTTSLTMASNYVLAAMYMDRNRTKLRGNLDWDATERLSVQVAAEHNQDDFLRTSPAVTFQVLPVAAGARTLSSDSISLDTSYVVSDDWKANGFVTRSMNRWNVNKINIGDDTRNTMDTVGVTIVGVLTAQMTIGIDVLSTRDQTTFKNVIGYGTGVTTPNAQGDIAGFSTTPGNYLPSIDYRTDKLNLRGKYALDKVSDVTMIVSFQQFKTNDWQWSYNGVPFVYSDNSTVSQPMSQSLKFVGASYLLRF